MANTERYQLMIEGLLEELKEQEDAVRETKKMINSFCTRAGKPIMFADADALASSIGAPRRDEYYGLPLAKAIRTFLDARRAANMGPATVQEIYEGLTRGGFHFETKNAENAKRGLYISLAKNSSMFHRLPGASDETAVFGLLAWYPAAKQSSALKPTKTGKTGTIGDTAPGTGDPNVDGSADTDEGDEEATADA